MSHGTSKFVPGIQKSFLFDVCFRKKCGAERMFFRAPESDFRGVRFVQLVLGWDVILYVKTVLKGFVVFFRGSRFVLLSYDKSFSLNFFFFSKIVARSHAPLSFRKNPLYVLRTVCTGRMRHFLNNIFTYILY